MACKFCERLEVWKRCQQITNAHTEGEKSKVEYAVALVEHRWFPSVGKRNAGRVTDYRNQGLGYKLNYCPECGKELR